MREVCSFLAVALGKVNDESFSPQRTYLLRAALELASKMPTQKEKCPFNRALLK